VSFFNANTNYAIGTVNISTLFHNAFLRQKSLLFCVSYFFCHLTYSFAHSPIDTLVCITNGTIVSGKFDTSNQQSKATTVYISQGTLVSNTDCFSNPVRFQKKYAPNVRISNTQCNSAKVLSNNKEQQITIDFEDPLFPTPFTISNSAINQGTAPTQLFKYRDLGIIQILWNHCISIPSTTIFGLKYNFGNGKERLFFIKKQQPRPPPNEAFSIEIVYSINT
jgi:hypothetical protein